jgi:hypothetical protein
MAMIGEKNPKTLRRREFLKFGAAAGTAIPVVLSLAPREARAEGSWHANSRNEWRATTRESFEMKGQMHKDPNQGFVFPGSYQWRERKREEEERRRQMRGDFDRFGSSEG